MNRCLKFIADGTLLRRQIAALKERDLSGHLNIPAVIGERMNIKRLSEFPKLNLNNANNIFAPEIMISTCVKSLQ
jgi:hypothetical protein